MAGLKLPGLNIGGDDPDRQNKTLDEKLRV
jgi:hypothetical protein